MPNFCSPLYRAVQYLRRSLAYGAGISDLGASILNSPVESGQCMLRILRHIFWPRGETFSAGQNTSGCILWVVPISSKLAVKEDCLYLYKSSLLSDSNFLYRSSSHPQCENSLKICWWRVAVSLTAASLAQLSPSRLERLTKHAPRRRCKQRTKKPKRKRDRIRKNIKGRRKSVRARRCAS